MFLVQSTLKERDDMVVCSTKHFTVVRVKAQLDQMTDGLNVLGIDIRQLYNMYAALVKRIPPQKIKGIVKNVLQSMAGIGSFQLPSKSCADYM